MRIGIVGPVNPASLAEWLNEKNIPAINTSASAVNTLVKGFLEDGHELQIFTLTTEKLQKKRELKGNRITIHLIPIGLLPKIMGIHQFVIGQFYLPQRIVNVIRKHIGDINVLHAHWTYEYAKAASLVSNKVPVFCTVRDWCPYQLSLMKGRSRLDWLLKNITFKQVMADERITFIANSDYTHRMITKAYPEKIVPVIPNPIYKDWIVQDFKNSKPIDTAFRFISIATGLCSPRKNIKTLLEAFAKYRSQHSKAELHLVGGYNENDSAYIKWKQRGWLTGVKMYGMLPHEQLMSLLDKMDCLVHPAWEETFGNILLEAMSRGVPCIGGQDSGAVSDVLGHGEYGLTCNIRDAQSILNTMEIISDSMIYHRLQVEAIKMLRVKYASDVVTRMHIEIFQSKINAIQSTDV